LDVVLSHSGQRVPRSQASRPLVDTPGHARQRSRQRRAARRAAAGARTRSRRLCDRGADDDATVGRRAPAVAAATRGGDPVRAGASVYRGDRGRPESGRADRTRAPASRGRRAAEGAGAVTTERHDDLTAAERRLLARAVAGSAAPREPRWGEYRAELRARLEARRSIGARVRRWWARPAPITLTLGLATALLLFTLRPVER